LLFRRSQHPSVAGPSAIRLDAIQKRLDAQFARFLASGFDGVPVYLWNGVQIPISKFEQILTKGKK
jgi:hypothetical protein